MDDSRRNPELAAGSTPNLVADVLQRLSSLVRSEFDLARAEIDQNLRRAGAAVGMLVLAVVMAITALNVLAAALAAAIAKMGLAPGWAALIVGAAFGLVAWFAMNRGLNALSLSSLAPTRTAENVKRDANVVTGGRNVG